MTNESVQRRRLHPAHLRFNPYQDENPRGFAMISASPDQVELTSARPLDAIQGYRTIFDLQPVDDSVAPIDVRVYLVANGQPLNETWLYQ